MTLVDALHINAGGGLVLLKYLIEQLVEKKRDFFLLYDNRCMGMFEYVPYKACLDTSLKSRKAFYLSKKGSFSSVLCFANVPPPVKMDVPVYTYFHNINLLTLGEGSLKSKIKCWVKRLYIHHLRKNTNKWLVQTSNTANEMVKHMGIGEEDIIIAPFYDLRYIKNEPIHGNDYVFIGDYTGYKGHDELLAAWSLLSRKGMNHTLHLTCSHTVEFLEKVRRAQKEGVAVENHGIISFEEVAKLYQKSKALVYPSSNESLGLGIVEAISSGCDVLSSDMPFTFSVCQPSEVFDPHSPESISEAVVRYENKMSPKTKLIIENQIAKVIGLLE